VSITEQGAPWENHRTYEWSLEVRKAEG